MDIQSPPPIATKAFVDWILSKLDPRQERILKEKFGLWDGTSQTLQSVGDNFAVTRERIHQIKGKSLTILRGRLGPSAVDTITEFIRTSVRTYLDARGKNECGLVSQVEVIESLADDCSVEEAKLALDFFKGLGASGKNILSLCFLEVEKDVYCLETKSADVYTHFLEDIRHVLDEYKRPLTEEHLWNEVTARFVSPPNPALTALFNRILAISPSFLRLPDQRLILSNWPRDTKGLAELAMRDLGKPAHFSEIARRIAALRPGLGPINTGTVHNVLGSKEAKFVLTGPGTYGLSEWGIERPPFVKDRLVQLLSESPTPLPYEHLKQKVLEVCNCKENSVRMTLDLNRQLFTKFHNERYGLRKRDRKHVQAKEERVVRLSKEERKIRKWAQANAEHPDATPEQREQAKKILTLLSEELSGEK